MQKEIKNLSQLDLFTDKAKEQEVKNSNNEISILFRNLIPEIPSTTYATFSIYKYPAKFIPQVIAFILKTYAKKGMKIFDPFAGYGTVGLVARIYGFDYELWDLNPILSLIHDTSIMEPPEIDLDKIIKDIKNSNREFIPKWSNLKYWYPEEFLPMLYKAWGCVHNLEDTIKNLILIPLINVTKYFSYDDEKVHKLYKSKYSLNKIKNLLTKNWQEEFYRMLEKEITILYKKLTEYKALNPKKVNYKIISGIDILEKDLEDEVNILITSPPYLQAQEYIRSTKMELFWLGYSEEYIRSLSKKEIPYRKVEKREIYSESFYKYREFIKEKHLLNIYDNYFYAVLGTFERLGKKVTDYMFIFVGPAKVRTISIPIDKIIIEHLKESGWKHEITYIDTIVSRVMFKSEINPASKEKDYRIQNEYLVVLKKL